VTTSAHSSLVLRACGFGNADNLYGWAMEHSGKAFLFSVLLEMDREPRWKADWLTGKHLVADAFGRVETAINKIPEESRPEAWLERLAKAREWIAENSVEGTSNNCHRSSGAPNLPTNDSALFSFRFRAVHPKDLRDSQLRQLFEVPLSYLQYFPQLAKALRGRCHPTTNYTYFAPLTTGLSRSLLRQTFCFALSAFTPLV
jgi:hypothetical protein